MNSSPLSLPSETSVSNAHAVEVLHYIQMVKQSNAIARTLYTGVIIDTGILYQALEHLMGTGSFTEGQLADYFQTQQCLEEFHRTLDESLQETLEVHLPYPVDFQLLGLDATRYSCLDHNTRAFLHQQYEILYFELLERYTTVEDFILSAQKLLTSL